MEQSRAGQFTIKPEHAINGWPLPVVFDLDAYRPGLARTIFASKGLQRQAFFFLFAEILINGALDVAIRLSDSAAAVEKPEYVIAETISVLDTRELLERLIGYIPDGLIGCLRKAGEAPLAARAYHLIVALLLDHEVPERGRTLRQLERVTSGALEGLVVLDRRFCRPDWIGSIRGARTAAALNITLEMARVYCGATDEDLMNSIVGDSSKRPSAWATRWADKAIRFPLTSPIKSPDFEPLASAEAMRQAGLKFGNCLKSKILSSFLGMI